MGAGVLRARGRYAAAAASSRGSSNSVRPVAGADNRAPRDAVERFSLTPSTCTPPLSQDLSPCLSDSDSDAASSSNLRLGPATVTEGGLLVARQRADASLERLRLQLRGFGDMAPVQYACWDVGTAVQILCPSSGPPQRGKVVRFDPLTAMFEVQLRDGSTRILPPERLKRVQRSRASRSSRSEQRRQSSTYEAQLPAFQEDIAMGSSTPSTG
eukprot:gnl/MRDRNA2_/MRDRNA2_116772_c0_seq1.p1 gnl/MRDRNA2_/MRDRNA2_116772_c0~~gnl/MRDRNA2_/MRDRNA2_116772_c0_seq1.p1  ORF type:complete len:213 (-),score=27.91 gnl/MRDRNA2_/MRDRNA2_116772_c0_seq1:200-838(-)